MTSFEDLCTGVVTMLLAVGITVTLFFVYVVPWLWHLVKPWIYSMTS